MARVLVVLEAPCLRQMWNEGVLMGPLDDIIEGCVLRLILAGVVIGLAIAVGIWLVFS